MNLVHERRAAQLFAFSVQKKFRSGRNAHRLGKPTLNNDVFMVYLYKCD